MRVLVFAGSLREHSFNLALARLVAASLRELGGDVDLACFKEFDAPLYNQDLLDSTGFPPGVVRFADRLRKADSFALASPEYAFSIPGPLKNLIDWSSQQQPLPWTGKPGLLLSASVSSIGGQRGLWALRVPLEAMGAHLYPQMFSLPHAHEALDPTGELLDRQRAAELREVVHAFTRFADRLTV